MRVEIRIKVRGGVTKVWKNEMELNSLKDNG